MDRELTCEQAWELIVPFLPIFTHSRRRDVQYWRDVVFRGYFNDGCETTSLSLRRVHGILEELISEAVYPEDIFLQAIEEYQQSRLTGKR